MPAHHKRKPPKEGSVYERMYKGTRYRLVVVKDGAGVGYKLGGKVFASPTGAARSITNGEVNGWAFWHIETANK